MLHALQPIEAGPEPGLWQELVKTGRLEELRPEEIVAACRRLDPCKDERLLGQLLSHVSTVATHFLAGRINPNRPNRGRDILSEVTGGMLTAILKSNAADGLGYETAFYAKLKQRLIDAIRRDDKRLQRYEAYTHDDEGEEIEPADGETLNPEEIAIMNDVIQQLPDEKRKAFLLRRAGFEYFSERADVPTIASIMKRSDKTVRKWVAEATKLIRHELGVKP